tara:strand:- start:2984 stop:4810 length:1827 start_codon:yes stop_codon:yes gene_type:complete
MLEDLRKINKVISHKDKKHLIFLGIVKFFSGLFDMIGIASVAPFIMVVTNRKILDSNSIILKIKETFELNNNEVIIFFAVTSILVIMFNQFFRIFTLWYENYASHKVWLNIHTQLFKYYVNQPFSFHLQRNSNSLLERMSVRANAAVAGVINPFFQILGHFFVLCFLSLLLILANPFVAIVLMIVTSIFYLLIFSKLRKKISAYGKFSPEFSTKTFKLVEQALKSIKDIKIKNNASYYTNLFNPLAKKYANTQVKLQVFSLVPRNLLEIFAYTFGFCLVLYFVMGESQRFNEIAVLIGIYAITLQKLLPAIQGAYQSIAQYKYYKPSFDIIYSELVESQESSKKPDQQNYVNGQYNFTDKLNFKNIKFNYPNSDKDVLDIQNLELHKGKFIGITGKSGSGKSTFVDILTGLLPPTKGNIFLDGRKIENNMNKKLQSCIGYVPQFSFMADDTIKNNIALGLKPELIDFERIKKAAEIANISEFIKKELPSGYETIIGEDGVKLSGGQRQRICIARAIYRYPQILIFDEATNSLDSLTENKIIDSITKFEKIKTIVMVTHRVSTLKVCDEILFFDKGKLEGKGSYMQLIETNPKFKDIEKKSLKGNIYEK